jgi:lysine-specific demethylase/histidyl-hydroxylase NO66
MTAPQGALQRCVGDPRRFAEQHWGREPLLLRSRGREAFADLLDLPDVDHLVTETLLRMPSFRLVKDGTPLPAASYTHTVRVGGAPVEGAVRPDRVLAAFGEGATIVLQALHRNWPPVGRFCRDLELSLTHPVQANAYVTPPTSKGFAVHHDTHDVFVLQTRGQKRWRVYRPLVELAGKEQPWKRSQGDPGEPVIEAELGPGDSLYIPRGFPHEAEAQRRVSIHVTVGILSYTWLDLWRQAMKDASEHRPFRESLPVGFARNPETLAGEMGVRVKELQEWLEGAAGRGTLDRLARRFWDTRRPMLAGQMGQLERLDSIDASTSLRRRPGSVFEVRLEGRTAVVGLGMRELLMPSFCEPALRFLGSAREWFTPADLPGLDPDGRVVLARRLVREGALEVEGVGG